jgi:hypothetical protein
MSDPLAHRYWAMGLIVCAYVAGLPSAARASESLRLIDDRTSEGKLVEIDRDWNFGFLFNQTKGTIPSIRIVGWGQRVPMPLGCFVALVDESVLMLDSRAAFQGIQNDCLNVDSVTWGRLSLPIDLVRSIVLKSPSNELERDRLMIEASADHDSDQLMLVGGDSVTGQVLDCDAESCRCEWEGRITRVPVANIAAIRLNPRFAKRTQPRPPYGIIGLSDGSRLTAQSIILDDKQLTIELPGGTLLRSGRLVEPGRDALVKSVIMVTDQVHYLSDERPASYTQLPYLTLPWPYGLNKNLINGQLAHDGIPYDKGIAIHATARIEFPIPSGFRRFAADLCLDDSGNQNGSVVFRVFLHQQNNWSEAFVSRIIRGSDRQSCSVNLGTADRISLVVDHADRADVGDHANWLNARLLR